MTAALAAGNQAGAGIPFYVWVVTALTAAHTMSCTAIMILPAVAPKVASDYGIDPSLIGYQISLMGLGLLISLVFFGNLTRRVGACRGVQIGHGLVGLGALFMVLPSVLFLLPGSLAFGCGFGVLGPSNSSLLTRFGPPERRNLLFSIQQTSIPSGGVLAAAIAPVMTLTVGWRWAFVVNAILIFTFVALLQRVRARWGDEPDRSIPLVTPNPLRDLRTHWGNRELRLLSLAGGAFCWAQFCVAGYTVVACVEVLNMSLILAGTVLIVLNITTAIGRMIAGWLADRHSASSVLAQMSWVMLAACLAMLWLDSSWRLALVYVLFSVLGITSGAWPGIVLAEVGHLAPKGLVGPYVSGTLVYTNLGKLVGPMLFAASYAVTRSYSIAFALIAGPALLAGYCLLALERDKKR
jgi:MFS family permease